MENPSNVPRGPGRRVLLGLLAICMTIGGFRFTVVAHEFFHQNTQRYIRWTGEVSYGPRPWIESWLLGYCAAATGMMLSAGVAFFMKRRWGLTLAGFAGVAWIITSFAG